MKKYLMILATLSVFLLCACSKPPMLLLYNNTESIISVDNGHKKVRIAQNRARKVKYPINGKLVIVHDNIVWEYEVNEYPPREYCQPIAASVIYAQIESDGAIYILLPKTKFPMQDSLSQPAGYPLIPRID